MKHFLLTSLVLSVLLSSTFTFAQNNYCGSDVMRKELIARHPEILQSEEALEDFTKQYQPIIGQRSGPIIIPVVFHIIHRGGTENISDAQILDQMRILNEDYSKSNADVVNVIPSFQAIVADMGIEFRLATKDPDGNCTNGIQHLWGSQTYLGNDFCKLNGWPRDKYLNIWVFRKMRDGVAGYAYLPGSVPSVAEMPMIDGINILNDYIGSIGTSSLGRSRALSHEVGHFLNLKHLWGDSNQPGVACGDDDVADTPPTKGFSLCPSNPALAAICNPPIIENYQNFMEYAYCENMFTEGQKARSVAALNNGIAQRNNLWSPSNLTATGTEQLTTPGCAPICDFSANKLFACVGDAVVYTDNSYNGDITSRSWSMPGSDILYSGDVAPVVHYDAAGVYPVTLNVVNATGSSTKTQALVTVKDTNMLYAPYYDNFDDRGEFDYWWSTINTDRDEAQFQYCTTAGRYQSHSVLLNTYRNRADFNVDELISPPFDCSMLNVNTGKLSFYYSFATWNSQFSFYNPNFNLGDSIVVLAQKGCGGTWQRIYADGSNNLFNAGFQDGYFTPGIDDIFWKKVSINIPSGFYNRGVRFRVVVMSSHEANNFYLDDWNVGLAPTGIPEQETVLQHINIMPNPFTSMVRLENLPDEQLDIEVRDLTGRLLMAAPLQPAGNAADIDLSGIGHSGIYLLTLKDSAAVRTFRVAKQ